MSEDGGTRPPGAPPEPSAAPFEVVIGGDGAATIDGDPVPVIGDQPLDTAILDTLHGYAQLRESPVTAAISNPATGYSVRVEVDPDGSSRLLGQGAGRAAESAGPMGEQTGGPAAGGGPAPAGGAPADGTTTGGAAAGGAVAGGDPVAATGAGKPRVGPASVPRPSLPRPPIPSLPRPSLGRRSPGGGGAGPRGSRGSDEEFEASSLLKKPWVVVTTAVAVAALVTTPLALAGTGDGQQENEARQKHVEGSKDEAGRGPSGTVRPSPPGFPTGSPSGTPSSDPSKRDKGKDADRPKSSLSEPSSPPKSDEASDDDKDEESHERDSSSGDEKKVSRSTAKIPSGTTMVVNRRTGKCMDLPGTGKGKPDGRVQQGACDTSAGSRGGNQRWRLDLKKKDAGPGDADLYLIRNVKDNLCLDLPAFGPAKSTTPVTEYHCRADNDNQLWWFDKQSDGTFSVRNHKSGHLCLDLADRKRAHSQLRIVGCEDNSVQRWRFRKP
ncbi:ricin-type beta-trefoil lectin domain protein [Streptomyces smyrnaeus]|uniref:Ricin-type beta-trefoil lectin domain protein n=1 Tax=Streptomyces smyrnaeus TaxID=1387713 RepID=A0ABS3XPE6_9ACTN|nr:RICIN domain-containing protein [Streptomyces smyrnaeus]MBO8197280.1 ricin-type beta-trefoil lectin domain protein [Streptomyces smyrnaeus]